MAKWDKKPLYRKVNTTAHGVHHLHGDDFRNTRHKATAIGMRRGVQRGLDYSPLFRFLLSKVGGQWDDVHSEAVSRLDREEPIFWLVAKDKDSGVDVVRVGESTYFSGLYVDNEGILRIVDPQMNEDSLEPKCQCCTHTFNGKVFTRPFEG